LKSGTRLNQYEIVSPLGEGGMGRVYLAEDTRLKRQVAIKVLPPDVADDPERLARLKREAQVLAQLDHPNVAGVYGLEECQIEDRIERFLVMQLADGETLGDRLTSGPLTAADAIEVARQVALGLDAAHAQGIVHRDLKPANIMLGGAGDVKIVDFGLAKAVAADGSTSHFSPELTASPTIMAATVAGVIMGTAPYMSPEQARGKPVDRRTDLWALGCVLFEMLTSTRAFDGETATDVIASVVQREPDWDMLPAETPAEIRRLLRRCLAKDPAHRLRDAGDAGLMLVEGMSADSTSEELAAAAGGPAARLFPWLVAAAAVTVAAVMFAQQPAAPASSGPARFSVVLPDGIGVPTGKYGESASLAGVALAPDASQLAFVGYNGAQGNLYVQRVGEFEATLLPGTLGATAPFFSPDGSQVAVFAGSRLWRIELPGGVPVEITPASTFAEGGSWGLDGTIVFTPSYADGLWIVPATGGAARQLTQLDRGAGEVSHRWPHFLPDGRSILFVVKSSAIESLDAAKIAVANLQTGEVHVVLEGGTRPSYLDSGQLVFARGSRLYAAPFDLTTLDVTGAPVSVLVGVASSPNTGNAFYATTRSGKLAYVAGESRLTQTPIVRLAPDEVPQQLDFAALNYVVTDLAPDGRRLLVGRSAANDELWIADLRGSSLTRLTSGEGNDQPGVWSPDGRWVIFASDRGGGAMSMFRVSADGSGEASPLMEATAVAIPDRLSRQAGLLGYHTWTDENGFDAYVVPVADDGTPSGAPVLVAGGPDAETSVAPSPDGSLVAYTSTASGETAVYVVDLGRGSRVRLTQMTGDRAAWAADGKRLFFWSERGLFVAPLVDAGSLTFGESVLVADGAYQVDFAIDADGRSLLATGVDPYNGDRSEIRLDLGWGQRISTDPVR